MGVAIAKFGDVLMEMTEGNFVILADDATFQQSPESFDSVGVNLAVYVSDLMVDDFMPHHCCPN